MKRVAKSIVVFLASTLYATLLFLSATLIGARFTLTNPDTVKSWLSDSGAYESIVSEVSKLATIQQANKDSVVQISADEITQSAQAAFPSTTIKRESETVIDGFYSWFKGDTSGPEFRVDLSEEKSAFALFLTQTLQQKIAALPDCKDANAFKLKAFDPFTADCKPKGSDFAKELTEFQQDITDSKDILPQTVFTGGDVKISSSGTSERVGSALPWVPKAYTALMWAPWVVVGLAVASAMVLIFFSTNRRKGVIRFASGLLATGTILIVSGVLLRPALEKINQWSVGSIGNQASFTEKIVNPLFEQVNSTYSKYSIYVGAAYVAISLFAYGGVFFTRGKKEATEEHHDVPQPQTMYTEQPREVESVSLQPQAPAPSFTQNVAEQAAPSLVAPAHQVQPAQPVQRPLPQASRPQRPVTRRPMIQG